MSNINSYTDMPKQNILNEKLNVTEVNNCNKSSFPSPNNFQIRSIIYQANIDYDIAS